MSLKWGGERKRQQIPLPEKPGCLGLLGLAIAIPLKSLLLAEIYKQAINKYNTTNNLLAKKKS